MTKLGTYASLAPGARSKTLRVQAPGLISADYLTLIQKLVDLRQEQPAGILLAFSSFSRSQGVTYVIESLACQLVQHTREQVLISSSSSLAGAAHATFWERQGIQRLGRGRSGFDFRMPGWEDLQTVRSRFGFVLVDCPSLTESSAILAFSRIVNGIVLVVASGEMRRDEIENGCKTLVSAGAHVVGLVLNKRTDPVPRLFSRWL